MNPKLPNEWGGFGVFNKRGYLELPGVSVAVIFEVTTTYI